MSQRLADAVSIASEKAEQHTESLHIERDLRKSSRLIQIDKSIVDCYDFTAVEAHMAYPVAEFRHKSESLSVYHFSEFGRLRALAVVSEIISA